MYIIYLSHTLSVLQQNIHLLIISDQTINNILSPKIKKKNKD